MRGDYQEQEYGARYYPQGLFEESATKKLRLGTVRKLDDGREFVYGQITSAAITAGGTLLAKDQAPVDGTIAAADAAIDKKNARKITVTAAAVTKNQFVDGELVVKAGTGIGCKFKIRANSATGVPAAGRVTIELYDKLNADWEAASTTVALHTNPYKDLLISPAVANEAAITQERAMGVSLRPITASYYAWIQKKGIGSLVLDVDAAAGAEANEMDIVLGTTAGRGAVIADTAYSGSQIVGCTLESGDLTDAEANLVMLDM